MSLREQEWVHQYNVLKSKVQSKRLNGVVCQPSDIKDLNDKLEFLSKSLQTMQASPMEYDITSSELARRQILSDNLRKQISMIVTTKGSFLSRGSDASNNNSFSSKSSNPSTTSRPSETTNPINSSVSNKDLVQRQRDIIQLQDDMMDDISKGVDRLHNQALEIGAEAKVHIKIMDELDSNVDKAADSLREEARHAEDVRKSSNVCWMYICIVVEVIIILIMLIIIFGKF